MSSSYGLLLEDNELGSRELREFKACECPMEALFGVFDNCGVNGLELM